MEAEFYLERRTDIMKPNVAFLSVVNAVKEDVPYGRIPEKKVLSLGLTFTVLTPLKYCSALS